jgi:hypothetical protein
MFFEAGSLGDWDPHAGLKSVFQPVQTRDRAERLKVLE